MKETIDPNHDASKSKPLKEEGRRARGDETKLSSAAGDRPKTRKIKKNRSLSLGLRLSGRAPTAIFSARRQGPIDPIPIAKPAVSFNQFYLKCSSPKRGGSGGSSHFR
jgi:hypothetical protein